MRGETSPLQTDRKVVLVEDDKETLIGTPLLKKAQVKGVILENYKDDKVIVFKKKRRKQGKRKKTL